MLRETVSVISHDGNAVYLKTQRGSTCSGCSLKGGCGQYLLARDSELLKLQDCELTRPLLQQNLEIGEQVQITLAEGQLLQLAGLFYGLPLLGLLLLTLLATVFEAGEGVLILAALAGLAGGIALSRLLMRSNRIRRSVSPQIHRMAAAGATETLVHGSSR